VNGGRLLLIVASVVMVAAALGGLYVVGSPAHQRQLRLDDQRVSALSMVSNSIHLYWTRHGALPDTLSAVFIQPRWQNDPVSGKPYVYSPLGKESYNLCANFDAPSDGAERSEGAMHMYVPPGITWKHPAGMYCFRFTADSAGVPSE
jgi:hypothetical protein